MSPANGLITRLDTNKNSYNQNPQRPQTDPNGRGDPSNPNPNSPNTLTADLFYNRERDCVYNSNCIPVQARCMCYC